MSLHILGDAAPVPDDPRELRRGPEAHGGGEVAADDRQQAVVVERHGSGIARPADHDPEERLARGRTVRIDARLEERPEYPDLLRARHEESETVERMGAGE